MLGVGTDHPNAENSRDNIAFAGLEANRDFLLTLDHISGQRVFYVVEAGGTGPCYLLADKTLSIYKNFEFRPSSAVMITAVCHEQRHLTLRLDGQIE